MSTKNPNQCQQKNNHDPCLPKTLVNVGQKMASQDIYRNKTLAGIIQK